MREFYVRCLGECDVCGGTGLAKHSGDDGDVYPCLKCDGTGKIGFEVPLTEALEEIAAGMARRDG